MALEVTLSQERIITIRPVETVTKTSLIVERIVDNYQQQQVIATIKGFSEPVVLWEGASYIAIGQWTDANVQTKVLELFDI